MTDALAIHVYSMFADNLGFLGHDPQSGLTFAIDPADAPATEAALEKRGWSLSFILNTHHHADHVGGNLALQAKTGAKIVGGARDRDRIPGIDIALTEGATWSFGRHRCDILFVPGHTSGHIAYHFPEASALFCGDTLFSIGCGRLFEGSPADMWRSLLRLRALADGTRVYCAHEYTAANCRFALSVDPENAALALYAAEVADKRARGDFTIPASLGREKTCNPFLRADAPDLMRRFAPDSSGSDSAARAIATFAALRSAKDGFR